MDEPTFAETVAQYLRLNSVVAMNVDGSTGTNQGGQATQTAVYSFPAGSGLPTDSYWRLDQEGDGFADDDGNVLSPTDWGLDWFVSQLTAAGSPAGIIRAVELTSVPRDELDIPEKAKQGIGSKWADGDSYKVPEGFEYALFLIPPENNNT